MDNTPESVAKVYSGYVGFASENMHISPDVGFKKSYEPYPIPNMFSYCTEAFIVSFQIRSQSGNCISGWMVLLCLRASCPSKLSAKTRFKYVTDISMIALPCAADCLWEAAPADSRQWRLPPSSVPVHS